jgi:hypothetical protein
MYNWTLLLADMNMLRVSGTAFSEVIFLDLDKRKKRHENMSSSMGQLQKKSLQN